MNILKSAFFLLLFSLSVFAGSDAEVLKYNAKIGFVNGEDTIETYKFLEDGKKIFLLGDKNLQIWDVATGKLLHSVENPSWKFSPYEFFFSSYISFNVPYFENWKNYALESNGKWIITTEKTGGNKLKSAVVRDLKDLKQIKVFDLPGFSIESVYLDEPKEEIYGFAKGADLDVVILVWDKETFQLKKSFAVDVYKWHQFIKNGEKAIVGSGDSKSLWSGVNLKHGDTLTLRDTKTGAIEKEFTAENLKPRTPFQQTTLTKDEKFLISTRDDRAFIWETGGDGKPRFEISAKYRKDDNKFRGLIGDKYIAEWAGKGFRIYDIEGNGTPKFEVASDTPNDSVHLFDKTNDGKYIVVADDRKISVVETAGNGKPIFEITRDSEKERFYVIKFLEEKNYLVVTRVNESEKKPDKTELYDFKTGKLLQTLPVHFGSNVKFTPDEKYLYDVEYGKLTVWNFAANISYKIPLNVVSYDSRDETGLLFYDASLNTERTSISPDGKFILESGNEIVTLYDIENGKEIQKLFDPEKADFSKKTGKLKNGEVSEAFWSNDGKFIYAQSWNSKTFSFWKTVE